ncbi:MAG: T9SS type A sorting domain-containing protein [Bacteroidales bacterium]|nr:T9SS type A sorting domain-containing protein [Bacteroidales bacterium]
MKKSITLLLLVILITVAGLQWVISSSEKSERERRNMVDTRIDNNGYYKRLAAQGLYVLNPEVRVAPAVFTGSRIKAFSVVTEDSPDVPVTTQNSTQSENSIFVSPLDNLVVLNSNNSTQNPVGSLYGANDFFSFDGTETWGGEIQGAGGSNSGDPTTAIGLNGRWYVNYITNPGGQGIAYSDDSGENWTTRIISPNPGSLADKNHLWIDNSTDSPYEGNLYNVWTDFGGPYDSEIVVSSSTDDGETWSSRIPISTAINAGSHNQGVNAKTGPNGEVYAAWAVYNNWPSDEGAIGFARSMDGGVTWEPAIRIMNNIRGIRTSETSKNHRVNSFPSMAVDISGGTDNGNIYIVWTNIGIPGVNTNESIDVYMIKSTDNGTTWSTPIRVNQDPFGVGREHYFPWICCDDVTGTLSVIFYDDRNVNSNQCETYCANSYDAGETWEDFKVSDVAFTPAPIPGLAGGYMGDYLGITARDGMVYPVWPDNRDGKMMTYSSVYQTNSLNIPFNLAAQVTFETGMTNLNWEFEVEQGFLHFNVYRDNVLVGTPTLNTYSDQLPAYGPYNYAVTAAYVDEEESGAALVSVQWGGAQIDVNPSSVSQMMHPETIEERQITISNIGQLDMNYTITSGSADVSKKVTNYANASGGSEEYISQVQMGKINQTSGADGYHDYTAISTDVKADEAVLLTITNGNPYDSDQCGVWIDWDQNGKFDDEAVVVSETPGKRSFTANIIAPDGAVSGTTRMRVRITNTGDVSPQGSTTYGEVEDYSLFVVSWLNFTPEGGVLVPGATDTITLTFNTTGMSLGVYNSTLNITSNDPNTNLLTIPIHLIVSDIEFITSAESPEICIGGSTQLFAQITGGTGEFTYYWETEAGELVSEEQNPVVSPTQTTTYFAYAVQGFTTIQSDPVVITVHSLPVVALGEDVNLCGEESVIIDAGNEGSTYLWSNGSTAQTLTVSVAEFGVGTHEISVQVTSAFGCVSEDAITVTIEALPTVNLGENQHLCGTEAILLDAQNAGSTYLWSNGATTQSISVSSLEFGYGTHEISVQVTSASGCEGEDALTVTIDELPTVSLGENQQQCGSDAIMLDAQNAGSTYLWSTGATTQTIAVSPVESGYGTHVISVTVTNPSGCPNNDAVELTFNEMPPVATLSTGIVKCLTESVTLDAGVTGYNYQWSNGATTQTIELVGSTVGIGVQTYYVDLISDQNCVTRSSESTVEFKDCSGLNENNLSATEVYPIPSTGIFTLKFSEKLNETLKITVFDANGNTVYSQENVTTSIDKHQINLTGQPSGQYNLVVEGKTTIQRKLIINR